MGICDTEVYPKSSGSAYSYGEDAFADINNLDHCLKYLNQTLMTFGFPADLNLQSNDPNSIVQACNCIYAILQQRQCDIEFRESANDQRQRLMSDMSRLEAKVERLDSQLSAKERELAAMSSKEQKSAAVFKAQIEKLQQERDEFQRLVVTTQQVRIQQAHELKKKEKEYVKLQERLGQVLIEKKKETKTGMDIMNLLQKEGRQRGTWNTKKADGDFYKMIVDSYETKKLELMTENTDLRALLRSMQADMRDFLNLPNDLGNSGKYSNDVPDLEEPFTPLTGRSDVFDLPFHIAKDQIEQSLRTKMTSIKERMVQLQESQRVSTVSNDASNRELELEAQLIEARSIITEQASLMNKQRTDDSRNSKFMQLGVERQSTFSEEEDRSAIEERPNQLEVERSSKRKMGLELDR